MEKHTLATGQTRSGAVFSPFSFDTIECTDFDLATSLKDALARESYEDDSGLTAIPCDKRAEDFWQAVALQNLTHSPLQDTSTLSTDALRSICSESSLSSVHSESPPSSPLSPVLSLLSVDSVESSPQLQAVALAPEDLASVEVSKTTPQKKKKNRNTRARRRQKSTAALSQPATTYHADGNGSVDNNSIVTQPTNTVTDQIIETSSKKRKNRKSHARRKKARMAAAKSNGNEYHKPRPEVISSYLHGTVPIQTTLNTDSLPRTSTGFTAKPQKRAGEGEYVGSLDELVTQGYRVIEWDGTTPTPLISKEGFVFAVLVGRPHGDKTWMTSCDEAFKATDVEGAAANFTEKESIHCRGDFPAQNVGVTIGFGATYPTNLSAGPHTKMMNCLLKNPNFMRLANFADATFNLWAPKLYKHYQSHLTPLFTKLPYLQPIFDGCVFPAAAFNFGGNVFTKAHRDCMNSAVGWCAIFSLGSFDPKKGGHIVFPDLQLIVEFPPGSLILIPSATLTHANTPVAEGDTRGSFTLYCAGNLFRYVDNGFRTDSQLLREDKKEYERVCSLREGQWEKDIQLYSTLDYVYSKQ